MTIPASHHPSQLALEGGVNFRDLGGNRAGGGRNIKPGLLYRSGALNNLSEKDQQRLAAIPVLSVVDYRDKEEVRAKPDALWEGINYFHVPANPLTTKASADLQQFIHENLSQGDAEAFMLDLYRNLPFNNEAYRRLVAQLMQCRNGAIVQHCSMGKDRTGIGSALVLFALGADVSVVMEDYLLTETSLATFREALLNELATSLTPGALTTLTHMLSAKEAFLDATLRAVNERYGSPEIWLEKEYGLGPEQRDTLQAFYLQ